MNPVEKEIVKYVDNKNKIEGDAVLADEKRFCDNGDGTVTDNETKFYHHIDIKIRDTKYYLSTKKQYEKISIQEYLI